MFKKVLSLVVVAILLVSLVVVGTVSVSATTKLEGSKIYFEVPEDWGELKVTTSVYVYLFVQGGEEYAPWQNRAVKMSRVDDTRTYEFEIAKSPAEGDWNIAIFSMSGGPQTYDLTIGPDCAGDTAYVTDQVVENPVDSQKTALVAAWKAATTQGPHIVVSSLGNVIGTHFLPGETAESVLANFVEAYPTVATEEQIAIVAPLLQAAYEANPPAEATAPEETTPEETTPEETTPEETTPEETTPEETTPEETTPEETTPEATEPEEGVRYDEYGRIGGIPSPWKYALPEQGEATDAWDGYFKTYYFEAPEAWLTENTEYKEEGMEIGFYWYSSSIGCDPWPGVAADRVAPYMIQQFIDENPDATQEEIDAQTAMINEEYGNIFVALAPSDAAFIIWNNGINAGLPTDEDYSEEKKAAALQTADINVQDWTLYEEGIGLRAEDFCGGITYITNVEEVENPETGIIQNVYHVGWQYFNPLTGEMTIEPLKDANGEIVMVEDAYGDMVYLNPYFDMDYSYTRPDSGKTEAATVSPTEAPTSEESKNPGTVDTAQDSVIFIVMGITTLAAVAFLAVRKRTEA